MHVEASTAGLLATDADTIVVGIFEGEDVVHDALRPLMSSGEASGAFKHLALAHAQGRRLLAIGLGERRDFGPERARVAAARAHGRARELAAGTICWEVPRGVEADVGAGLVEGTLLHAYRFGRYKPVDEEREVTRLILSAEHDLSGAVRQAAILAEAQNRARDLANAPANDLSPEALAEYAQRLADHHDAITVTVLEEDDIRQLGMGAFAAVAQGSARGARLIRLDYEGPRTDRGARTEERARLALVGKAVTFDSGGLSLKSAATMHEMKFDMAGGAAVIEAVGALAELAAPVRVLGLVGATENLPSGTAVKPGDIVRTLAGTTIEVTNTDAEGRLVLADCLTYAGRQGCDRILDIATLTGGIVVALGSTYAGLMATDDDLARHVEACAQRTGELVWRMPLHPEYADMIKSRYAELVNSTERREALALTAAELLHHFAGELPWAHLDIAGTAWDVRREYFADRGATGFGVRLLVEVALRSGSR